MRKVALYSVKMGKPDVKVADLPDEWYTFIITDGKNTRSLPIKVSHLFEQSGMISFETNPKTEQPK